MVWLSHCNNKGIGNNAHPPLSGWGSSMYDDNAQDYTKDNTVSNKRMCSMKALLLLLSI